MRDPWEVLQIPAHADEETIRRAYRRLVKLYHPDLTQSLRKRERNNQKLEDVMTAYRQLLDRLERRRALESLRHGARPGGGSRATRPAGRDDANAYKAAGDGSRRTTREWTSTARKTEEAPADRDHRDPWVRYGELLLRGKNPTLRAMAARSLGKTGRRSAFGYLKQAFRDPDDRVVCEAVRSVGVLKIRQARGDLTGLFSRGSVTVKHAVLDCVEALGDLQDYGSLLQSALRDTNESIRDRGLSLFARYQKVRENAN